MTQQRQVETKPWQKLSASEREHFERVRRTKDVEPTSHDIHAVYVDGTLVGFIADGSKMARFIWWFPIAGDAPHHHATCFKSYYGYMMEAQYDMFRRFFFTYPQTVPGFAPRELFACVDAAIRSVFDM